MFEKTKTMAQTKQKSFGDILASIKYDMEIAETFLTEDCKKILIFFLQKNDFTDETPQNEFAEKFKIGLSETSAIYEWIYSDSKIDVAFDKPVKKVLRRAMKMVPLTSLSNGVWGELQKNTGFAIDYIEKLLKPVCEEIRKGFFTDPNFFNRLT